MNQSQMLTSHFAILFIALFHFISHIQLAMDDVSSETCFVFIEKYKKNDFQKHRGVHQTPSDTEKNSQRLKNDFLKGKI